MVFCMGHWFLSLLVCLLVLASAAGAVQSTDGGGGDWPMLQHDATGSGFNPQASGPTGDVGPRWVVRTDGAASNIQPVVVNETVYVGSGMYSGGGRGVLFAIDAQSGAVDWRTDLGDSVHTTAAVGSGRVYVIVRDEADQQSFVDDSYTVVAVKADSGETVWRTPLVGEDAEWVTVESGLVLAEDRLFLSLSEARGTPEDSGSAVLAYATKNGSQLWRHDARGEGFSVPTVADGAVYMTVTHRGDGAEPWSVRSLDAADGSVRWESGVQTGYTGVPPLPTSDWVIVPGDDLLVMDPANGSIIRRYEPRVYSISRPALANGTLYYPTASGEQLAALDLASGEVVWNRTVSGYEVDSAPSVGANHVYVGTVGGTVEAYDRTNGDPVWNVTFDDRFGVDTTPVVVGGTVYVGPAPFHVYALAEGGTARPGGAIGGLVDWLATNAWLGALVVGLLAILIVGLVGGLGLYGLMRGLHFTDAPPRLLAARLFDREYGAVSSQQVLAAHLLATVAILGAFVLVGALLTVLGTVIALGGVTQFGLLAPVGPFLLFLVVLGGTWAVVAYRWLPQVPTELGMDLGRARRQWAILHGLFALVAAALPVVFFLLYLIIFQPF